MRGLKFISVAVFTFCLIHSQILIPRAHAQMDMGGSFMDMASDAVGGMSVSAVNASLARCKGGSLDMLLAMLAGGSNAIGGIFAFSDMKFGQGDSFGYQGGTKGDRTTETIQNQIRRLKEARVALRRKMFFQTATVSGYLVAAGVALAKKYAIIAAEKACSGAAIESAGVCETKATECEAILKAYSNCTKTGNFLAVEACQSQMKPKLMGCTHLLENNRNAHNEYWGTKTSIDEMDTCEGRMARVPTEDLTKVRASLEAQVPSTQQAQVVYQVIDQTKDGVSDECGKGYDEEAIENSEEAKDIIETSKYEVAAMQQLGKVGDAIGKAKDAVMGMFRTNKNVKKAGRVGKLSEATANNISKGSKSIKLAGVDAVKKAADDQPDERALCSVAGSVMCTKYLENLRFSLAECTESLTDGSGMSAAGMAKLFASSMGAGGIAGGVGQLAGTMAVNVDKYMLTASKRGIIYGAASTLTGLSAATTKNQINKVSSRIKKLQNMLNDMHAADGGGEAPLEEGVPEEASQDSASSKSQSISPITHGSALKPDKINLGSKSIKLNKKTPCLTANCKSPTRAINKSLKALGSGISKGTKATLGKGAALLSKLANGVQGKDKLSGGVFKTAAELAKQKKALQKAVNGLKKKINNALKKNKQKQMNFKGLEAGALKAMQDPAENAIKTGLIDLDALGDMLASSEEERKAFHKDMSFNRKKGRKSESKNRFGGGSSSDIALDIGDDINTEENPDDSMENLKNFVDNSEDIVNDRSVPIWRVITSRYVRSALSRLGLLIEEEDKEEKKDK